MKRILSCLAILAGSAPLWAQDPYQPFDLASGNFKYTYRVELDNRELLLVETTQKSDLQCFYSIDTLVQNILESINLLNKNVADPMNTVRLDFITDHSASKKIRMRQYPPTLSHYLVSDGQLAYLKTGQDTVTITGIISRGTGIARIDKEHYYRLTFILNDIRNLGNYNGRLGRKIDLVREKVSGRKYIPAQTEARYDPEIKATEPGVYVSSKKAFLFRLSVDAQNFKNYFVPSLSGGFGYTKINNVLLHDYTIGSELHFLFSPDADGKLRGYENRFITFSYERSKLSGGKKIPNALNTFISFGYLIHRKGDFYEKNIYKLVPGRFSLFSGSTKVEPTLYFSGFLNLVSPSLRIVQRF